MNPITTFKEVWKLESEGQVRAFAFSEGQLMADMQRRNLRGEISRSVMRYATIEYMAKRIVKKYPYSPKIRRFRPL